jgi:hypothetical protein
MILMIVIPARQIIAPRVARCTSSRKTAERILVSEKRRSLLRRVPSAATSQISVISGKINSRHPR